LRTAGIAESRENGFHALRHHFASVLLHDGVDIAAHAADRMRSVVDKALSLEADGPGGD
jgi:4-diphosphocytidyl-2C-methyl-D-erythritol kinase